MSVVVVGMDLDADQWYVGSTGLVAAVARTSQHGWICSQMCILLENALPVLLDPCPWPALCDSGVPASWHHAQRFDL